MSRHYHVITCDDENTLDNFIRNGRVGIRPVIMSNTSSSVRMNWDILAEIARVKAEDRVLLHAKVLFRVFLKCHQTQ